MNKSKSRKKQEGKFPILNESKDFMDEMCEGIVFSSWQAR